MGKTEQKLLKDLAENGGRYATFGTRENNAARKLEERGLIKFTNTSHYVTPRHSNIRRRNGDYVGFHVTSGRIELV